LGVIARRSGIAGYYLPGIQKMFIYGNDVYAAGAVNVPTGGGTAATYWKNGVST